jgi:protein-S-isoprenylcysteine O-methyltransferase Ste14
VEQLWQGVDLPRKVVLEGPLAHNPLYLALLQALLPQAHCMASHDAMEGTARGAWLLSRWSRSPIASNFTPLQAAPISFIQSYHERWLATL